MRREVSKALDVSATGMSYLLCLGFPLKLLWHSSCADELCKMSQARPSALTIRLAADVQTLGTEVANGWQTRYGIWGAA